MEALFPLPEKADAAGGGCPIAGRGERARPVRHIAGASGKVAERLIAYLYRRIFVYVNIHIYENAYNGLRHQASGARSCRLRQKLENAASGLVSSGLPLSRHQLTHS